MLDFGTLTSLTYLVQVASRLGHAQTNGAQLLGIVPKREVLYIGGQYKNITARLDA